MVSISDRTWFLDFGPHVPILLIDDYTFICLKSFIVNFFFLLGICCKVEMVCSKWLIENWSFSSLMWTEAMLSWPHGYKVIITLLSFQLFNYHFKLKSSSLFTLWLLFFHTLLQFPVGISLFTLCDFSAKEEKKESKNACSIAWILNLHTTNLNGDGETFWILFKIMQEILCVQALSNCENLLLLAQYQWSL